MVTRFPGTNGCGRPRIGMALTIGALLAVAPVAAQNVMFLKDAPVARMNAEDIEIQRKAAVEALTVAEIGRAVAWENPKTGSAGRITALERREIQGTPCADVEIWNSAGGRSGKYRSTLCRQSDGSWQVKADK